MAKKKKTTKASRKTKKPKAKTKLVKRPTAKAKAKSTKPKSSNTKTPTSVDGILKKFGKQRATLDSQAISTRNKIEALEKKVNQSLAQIDKLIEKETATKKSLNELDARRDSEVSALLAKLGVKFSDTPPEPTEPATTQSSVSKTDSNDSEDSNDSDEETDEKKPSVTFATTGPHSGKG